MGASKTMQKASKVVDQNLVGASCDTDKLAFSTARTADVSVDERIKLAKHVIV